MAASESTPQSHPINNWLTFLWLGLILLAVFFVFSPALKNGFVNWDDDNHLLKNPSVLSLSSEGITAMFNSTVNRTYIPLTTLSFAVEHHFAGFQPFVYHLDNLILHLAVTALVFLLGLRLGLARPAAALAALLFGIHPMHVESVAWVTERKDVLCALFYLLALHAYWSYLNQKSRLPFVLSVVCGVLSLLAKPMALSLPLILLLMDHFHGRPLDFKSLKDKVPFLIYTIPITWTTYALNARVPAENISDAVLTWAWSFSFYLEKFVFPVPLTLFYQRPLPVALTNPAYIISIGVCLLACAGVWAGRKNPWIRLAFGYYVLSIFFLLRFDGFDPTIVADRFMYLPSLGLCFLFGYFVHYVLTRGNEIGLPKILTGIAVVILLGVFSIETFAQTKIWNNSLTLWNHVLKYAPNNDTAYYCRGDAYLRLGKYDLALEDMNKALEIPPDTDVEYYNRAVLFDQTGKFDLALKDYDLTLQINPNYVNAYNNKALIYSNSSRYAEALETLTKATAVDPSSELAFYNRGIVYELLNDPDAALKDYSSAIALNPNLGLAYQYRSRLWFDKKEWGKALADARRAQSLGIAYSPEEMAELEKKKP